MEPRASSTSAPASAASSTAPPAAAPPLGRFLVVAVVAVMRRKFGHVGAQFGSSHVRQAAVVVATLVGKLLEMAR